MGLEKLVLNIVLGFFSIFLRFVKVKPNQVTFISLTTDKLTGDFKAIYDELTQYEGLEIKLNLLKFKKNLWGDFLYFLNCIKQLFLINASKVVIINDNNYIISNFKKNDVKVIQIWHACGAVKKFGNEISRQYKIANYDYVLATSKAWQHVYARSFGVHPDNVIPLGLPRTDELFNHDLVKQNQNSMLQQYPILKDKYVILYAPTFRGNIIKGLKYDSVDLVKVIEALPENYVLMYKMHPLLGNLDMGQHERLLNMNNELLNALMCIADCLISDYSSIVFDYSILHKKMVFYLSDLQDYQSTIGLNVLPEELPGVICTNEDNLIEELNNPSFDEDKIDAFKDKYFFYQDGQNAKRIAKFVKNLINDKV